MKYFLIALLSLLSSIANAQNMNSNIDKDIKAAKTKVLAGKIKEAIIILNTAQKKATDRKDDEGTIATTILLQDLQAQVQEQQPLAKLNAWQKLQTQVAEPYKQIVSYKIAEEYKQLYNNYKRYQEVTTTVVEDLNQPNTWSAETYYTKILEAHQQALANPQLLLATDMNKMKMLFPREKAADKKEVDLRKLFVPNLYYTLVKQITSSYATLDLDINTNEESYNHKAYDGLEPLPEFLNKKWNSKDKYSNALNGLQFYQEALQVEKNNEEARAYLDFNRLQFANELNDEKRSIAYLNALTNASKAYGPLVAGDLVKYELANKLQGNNNDGEEQEDAEDNKGKPNYDNAKAIALCDEIIKAKRHTSLVDAASQLRNAITQGTVRATTENIVIPNTNYIAKLDYKNITSIKVTALKLAGAKVQDYLYDDVKLTKNSTAVWSKTYNLPACNDYANTSTEIELDALPVGQYVLRFATADGKVFCLNSLQASNLQIIHTEHNSKKYLAIVNRTNGAVIQNANFVLTKTAWNNAKRQNEIIRVYAGNTKSEEIIELPNVQYEKITLQVGDDILDEGMYHYPSEPQVTEAIKAYQFALFTDRAIYRPGQKVHYKFIAEYGDEIIATPKQVEVVLKDVNGNEVAKQQVSTNNFGSASGIFNLPTSTLSGNFSIHLDGQYATSIKVEEYKRPKFEVLFDSVKTQYKLGDAITIKGKAMGYNGAPISNAKVNYTVERTTNYPYRWCWWPQMRNNTSMQISSGNATTNDKGEFTIEYKASDNVADEARYPIYNFTTNATVIDANGETHEAEQEIKLSKNPLTINIEQLHNNDKAQAIEIKVAAKNLQDIEQNETVTLSIYELETPQNIRKTRLWDIPANSTINANSFNTTLGTEEITNEIATLKSKVINQVLNNKNIETNKIINIEEYLKTRGAYKIVVIHKSGIKGEMVLINYAGNKLMPYEVFETEIANKNLRVKEPIQLNIFCNVNNATALLQYTDNFGKLFKKVCKINKGTNSVDLPALPDNNSKGAYDVILIHNNRTYSKDGNVLIKEEVINNKLQLITFRNKILPGSKQEWTLGLQKHSAATKEFELLASMYDASLDQFERLNWPGLKRDGIYQPHIKWQYSGTNMQSNFKQNQRSYTYNDIGRNFEYHLLNSNFLFSNSKRQRMGIQSAGSAGSYNWRLQADEMSVKSVGFTSGTITLANAAPMPALAFTPPVIKKDEEIKQEDVPVKSAQPSIRKNLQETAFFLPHLEADKEGNYKIKFEAPEALTKWRMMCYGHNTDKQEVYLEKYTTTQKELMVVPNMPRFLRNEDAIDLKAKINNLTNAEMNGTAQLQILDAGTEQDITNLFCKQSSTTFKAAANGTAQISFPVNVDAKINAPVIARVFASSGTHSDGEQLAVPIMSNKILVTESVPILLQAKQEKKYELTSLTKGNVRFLPAHLNVQTTSNPTWYAVQALPYITSYSYECTEQLFSKWYAYKVAKQISNQNPQLRNLFAQWITDTNALKSNLQKNETLKQLVLNETPWVQAAANETEQKYALAKVFTDAENLVEIKTILSKIRDRQQGTGGFSWWPNMQDNDYITTSILTGIAKLRKMQAVSNDDEDLADLIINALRYCDSKFLSRYETLRKIEKKQAIGANELYYLFMRAQFMATNEPTAEVSNAVQFYFNKIKKEWTTYSIYNKSMAASALHNSGNTSAAKNIAEAIIQNITTTEGRGSYFQAQGRSWYWQDNQIDQQASVISTLQELGYKQTDIAQLQLWLLLKKQSNYWSNTKSTADVVHALLIGQSIASDASTKVKIQLGNKDISTLSKNKQVDNGTGVHTYTFAQQEITNVMGNISAKNEGNNIAWGSATLQYLAPIADVQKQAAGDNALSINKIIYKVEQGPRGEVLTESKGTLQVGDKVRIRLSFSSDREMDYVHIKDLRSACLEPTDVISAYNYKNGVGYYQVTKDVSTNFFIESISKGNYILEYDAFVNSSGNYSEGLASIQCMYAPEFVAHSSGGVISAK
jgi:hypothetical protein